MNHILLDYEATIRTAERLASARATGTTVSQAVRVLSYAASRLHSLASRVEVWSNGAQPAPHAQPRPGRLA